MNRLMLLLALCALIVTTMAASPPSFCKCTCFTNSTIIPLSAHGSVPPTSSNPSLKTRAPPATCAMCNRAFCLSQRLPICKDAEETDVFTTCFQRDSRKDQIVVLTFITGTLGLLGWSGVRKILEKRKLGGLGDVQQGYLAVGGR
ncbi:hypothetical protein BP5796_07767 [Coleophoma crateriformis]|uniref:Uncharacterized protein n=1 Tax=Coleophoma crateriformis TaxID=565419 RepID=A0A3D8RCF5_9HELO|nr:hypothetical protein BP5796_07767 [Coleophoma crateriformis]